MHNEELRKHTVKVKDGSGVMLNTYIADFSYVLTCYHVIENMKVETVTYCIRDDKGENWIENTASVTDVFCDVEHDVAILRIEHLDVEFVAITQWENTGAKHSGYPACRKGEDENYCEQTIKVIERDVNNGFVEYEYDKPLSDELKGMSGGGIFQNDALVGIHKCCSVDGQVEYDGKSKMIPIKFYVDLLNKEGLPSISEFDVASFDGIKNFVFQINVGKLQEIDIKGILNALNLFKSGVINISPITIYEDLVNKKHYNKSEFDLNRICYWSRFMEYMIGMNIMYDIKMDVDGVEQMMNKAKFISIDGADVDLMDIRDSIDEKYLHNLNEATYFIVSGLADKHNKYGYDVIQGNKIPDIAKAIEYEHLDVADYRSRLPYMKFVNQHIFIDAIVDKSDSFAGKNEDDSIKLYKQLLIDKIHA